MKEIVFTHSGSLGDILFSLHFIRDYSEWKGADRAHMLLTYGKPAVHGEGASGRRCADVREERKVHHPVPEGVRAVRRRPGSRVG